MKDKEKDKIIYKSIYLILYAQLIQFLILLVKTLILVIVHLKYLGYNHYIADEFKYKYKLG